MTGTTGATFGYKLSGATSYISEGTATSYQPTAAHMGEGSKTVCVAEKDVIDYGPEAFKSITVDRTNPAIAITSNISPELMVTSVNPTFSGTVSDALWRELASLWSTQQLMELLVLAGWYHAIGYV